MKPIKYKIVATPKKIRHCPKFDDDVNVIKSKASLEHGDGRKPLIMQEIKYRSRSGTYSTILAFMHCVFLCKTLKVKGKIRNPFNRNMLKKHFPSNKEVSHSHMF